MHTHPPVARPFFIALTGSPGITHSTVHGEIALAADLRALAREHGASRWEFTIRETLAALIRSRALIVRDADGVTLDEISIKATLDATWRPSGVWAARSRRFVYRCGPVPHTSFRSRGSYYRSPHTNATRVAEAAATADAFDPDLELEPRFAARVARLSKHVTAWDDVPRCRDRSWKRQRLTRWR
ncbi:MAG TPA: hypothetical protein P5256_09665 [Beijerinckiaceae bacterium]|nr:hypothetical protein [Hyphomicrobiales bacterium]HRY03385.1 hypothetical protein [Beijerinckiaceae bacterium]